MTQTADTSFGYDQDNPGLLDKLLTTGLVGEQRTISSREPTAHARDPTASFTTAAGY
jgi:hypothetical protein